MQKNPELQANTVFIENFKKLYSQQSIETILNDFANCYLEVSELESILLEREEKIDILIRKEALNA